MSVGLFQTKEYGEIFAKNFCDPKNIIDGIWEIYEDKLVLLGMKPVLPHFAEASRGEGGQEVTDYAKTDIKQLPTGYKKIQLDYVREDSETYTHFAKSFARVTKQEVSPYIELPSSWEEYLGGLERKYRKELKRKFKRLGETEYQVVTEKNIDEFVRLHRLSDPAKNKFMSEPMAKFFKDVVEAKIPGWKVSLNFLKIEDKYAAGIMSFENQDEWWLYNSGYGPEFSFYSVGLLLKALSIKQAIEAGKKKYDFLRGSERYKYELGGKNLQLYKIEIEL
ncbi:MAG: GNAT family N-acetyltransferase [Candidatus Beckwithbacteria bacterium]|nr:GNAT family N-acetyltransferase [Candidatus Beckwithbacteria bacterium]